MAETKEVGIESAADGVGLFDAKKELPAEEDLDVALETAHRESRKVSNLNDYIMSIYVLVSECAYFIKKV